MKISLGNLIQILLSAFLTALLLPCILVHYLACLAFWVSLVTFALSLLACVLSFPLEWIGWLITLVSKVFIWIFLFAWRGGADNPGLNETLSALMDAVVGLAENGRSIAALYLARSFTLVLPSWVVILVMNFSSIPKTSRFGKHWL